MQKGGRLKFNEQIYNHKFLLNGNKQSIKSPFWSVKNKKGEIKLQKENFSMS